MKEYCLLMNPCGDRHCCAYCLEPRCSVRCLDDIDECKYLCEEKDLPPRQVVVKIKKEYAEEPVRRGRRKK